MAKNKENPNQTEAAGMPEKKTRKSANSHPLVMTAQAAVKEAKSLARVIDTIPVMSEWGCRQIQEAVNKRLLELLPPQS
jgi:hypothetical protein